jgi:predicted TIM-barrel fold metal-dependent hydrolase
MQTPWGDLEVHDAHVHFFSRPFFASLATQSNRSAEDVAAALGWQLPPEDARCLAEQWVDELDRHTVRRSCLIASIPGDEASVATAVGRFPDRFTGYAMVNPLAPDSVERTRGMLSAGRIRGLCFFPAMQGYSIQDARVTPMLDAVREHPGTVVFVHCGVLTVGVRKKLGLPSFFDMQHSNPITLHAVALRYPKVAFVVPHFGAGYFREALMLADLCPNVYLDTSSSNSWVKYQPNEMDLRAVFRRSLDLLGAGRLLFGTDSSFFPRGWNREIFERQARCLYELGISAGDARKIFSENLEGILTKA